MNEAEMRQFYMSAWCIATRHSRLRFPNGLYCMYAPQVRCRASVKWTDAARRFFFFFFFFFVDECYEVRVRVRVRVVRGTTSWTRWIRSMRVATRVLCLQVLQLMVPLWGE